MYQPPYEITSKIVEYISLISEKVGEIRSLQNSPASVKLRRENRIKTIHSSLAIENNTLSMEQITAIIEGKKVLGSPREITEVKNAIETYELLLELDPFSEADLLHAHKLMMCNLVDTCGKYRSDSVGIFDGQRVVHVAPPAARVPLLMQDLFDWLAQSDAHPLIKSCVFHYEFEFIHPFQDGNGRIGRLWQTVILKNWREIFAWLPTETLVMENQKQYYNALGASDKDASSTKFTEFMLSIILKTIEEVIESEKTAEKVTIKVTKKVTEKVTIKVTNNQKKILLAVEKDPHITQAQLAQVVGISRKSIISNMKKLSDSGIISRVGSNRQGYWRLETKSWKKQQQDEKQ